MTSRSRPVLGLNVVGGEGWMGGLMYVRNIVACLARLPAAERPDVVLVGGVSANEIVDEMLSFDFVRLGPAGYWLDRTRWSKCVSYAARIVERTLRGRRHDPWFRGIDVVYPSLAPTGAAAREIFWVPDFQQVYLPDMFSAGELETRRRRIAEMAATDATIVFSSRMAADDFRRLHPGANARARIFRFCSVVAVEPGPDPRPARNLPERYLYVANQFWAHKNHMQVLEALVILRRRGVTIPLVCTGREEDHRNPGHMPSVHTFIAERGLCDQVTLLGMVPRGEQIQLFRYASAVIQPSRFEGWSTVIEDAKSLGKPLYVSDFPVHREQLDEAVFFPLDDVEALADILARDWPGLRAGPDQHRERMAMLASEQRQLACARDFMSIMRSAAVM